MRKLVKIALVAVCIMCAGGIAKAQVKIGYLDMKQLVDQMPETKAAMTTLQAYQKQFMDQLTSMNTELQTKGKAYQDQRATMTDAVRTAKEAELGDMQKRFQDFQTSAQQQVEAKQNEIAKPIIDKARAAAAQVAKEKGYAYVIDSSATQLLVSPPTDDMMADVKAKLGIK
jgi:outer membrane protein